jgi:HEPN domain-containing protein
MSAEKRSAQAIRWFTTAQDDFQSAEILHKNGKFAQSCFFSQQAGEKAFKALFFLKDLEPWGHSLVQLEKEFVSEGELSKALQNFRKEFRELDRYYIPTRYPDGLPGTTPSEAYGSAEAESAIASARKIVEFVNSHLYANKK